MPVGFAGMASRSWHVYRATFPQLLALFGTLYLAINLVYGGLLETIASGPPSVASLALNYVFAYVLPALLGSFAFAATAPLVESALLGRPPVLGAALAATRHRVADLLPGATMATLVAVVLGSFNLDLLGLPFVFYGPPVVAQVLMLEEGGYRRSGTRTRALASGNTLRLLGYFFTVAVGIAWLLDLGTRGTLAGLVGTAPHVAAVMLALTVRGLLFGFLLPFLACAMTVMYFDLRARARGLTTARERYVRQAAKQRKGSSRR